MLKKLICTLLVFIITLVFGMTAFADPTDSPKPASTPTPAVTLQTKPSFTPSFTPSAKTQASSTKLEDILTEVTNETKQFLVTITRPEYDTDSTYKSSYVISGVSASTDTDITVVLQVYDKESESYVPMQNSDGESSWEIGSFGVFSKELQLTEGENKIRILAYKTSQNDWKLKDIQANKFTVTLLKSGIKDIFKGVVDFTLNTIEKIKF